MNSTFILSLLLLRGIGRKTIWKILRQVQDGISSSKRILDQSETQNIHSITPFDTGFPSSLKFIDDPPVLIFYRGDISILEYPKRVAIIGTRNPSEYGITVDKQTVLTTPDRSE